MKLTLYCIIILVLTSCSYNNSGIETANDLHISLSYRSGESTDTGDQLNETRIDKVDLLFFNGQQCVYYPTGTDMTVTDGKIKIVIPDDRKYLFDNVTKYTIIAIANSSATRNQYEDKTFDEVRGMVLQSDFAIDQPQSNFIMFGKTETILSREAPNMGEIRLNRLASKVLVKITAVNLDGFEVTSAYASMVNYTDQTAINDAAYKIEHTQYKTTNNRRIEIVGQEEVDKLPFYSYANHWRSESTRTSYILLTVPCTNIQTQITKNYYYKVPFFVTDNGISKYTDQILNNYFYNFSVKISEFGGETPETAHEIKTNFQIINWYNNEIEVNINQFRYLSVDKSNFEMLNTDTETITVTSNVDFEIANISAKCSYINSSGAIQTIVYTNTSRDFPVIEYNNLTNKITVTSEIPTNYLTKEITFRITAKGSSDIYEDITIYQQPAIVISSIWAQNGDLENLNKNIYKIRIIAINNDYIFKLFFAQWQRFLIGDATELVSGKLFTKQDKASNRLASPEFVISSQTEKSIQSDYTAIRNNCNKYKQAPYTSGTWRLPTQAELLLVGLLQNDPSSPIKNSLQNASYWTANTSVVMAYPALNFQQEYYNRPARCVYDTWK